MKKYLAQIDENNIVVNIIVADEDFNFENCLEYTASNPAYIGGDFFEGYFYPPQPYPSWIRKTGNWISPIEKPDGFGWAWDETLLEWINVNEVSN